jgi:hypothetical protein
MEVTFQGDSGHMSTMCLEFLGKKSYVRTSGCDGDAVKIRNT